MIGEFITKDGHKLSYEYVEGKAPVFSYFHGFMSSKQAYKASIVKQFCAENGYGYFAFDATGHGESDGTEKDISVGAYFHDALEITDALVSKPMILTGSSFGGWIITLLAEQRPDKIKGFIGLASAVDFTQDVWDNRLTDELRNRLKTEKIIGPDEETKNYCWTYHLFEDGRNYLLLNRKINYRGPVILIHGDQDDQVPYTNDIKIKEALLSDSVELRLLKGANHFLSEERDVKVIQCAMKDMLQRV